MVAGHQEVRLSTARLYWHHLWPHTGNIACWYCVHTGSILGVTWVQKHWHGLVWKHVTSVITVHQDNQSTVWCPMMNIVPVSAVLMLYITHIIDSMWYYKEIIVGDSATSPRIQCSRASQLINMHTQSRMRLELRQNHWRNINNPGLESHWNCSAPRLENNES